MQKVERSRPASPHPLLRRCLFRYACPVPPSFPRQTGDWGQRTPAPLRCGAIALPLKVEMPLVIRQEDVRAERLQRGERPPVIFQDAGVPEHRPDFMVDFRSECVYAAGLAL